jgi:hypothetical protein
MGLPCPPPATAALSPETTSPTPKHFIRKNKNLQIIVDTFM